MFQLMEAQHALEDARSAWNVSHSAQARMNLDRATRLVAIAEAKLNISIRSTHIKAA